MSRGRFGLLLALAALLVGLASFGAALAVLDDGGADDPPGRSTAADDGADDPAGADQEGPADEGELVTGELPSPSVIAIVRSEADEEAASSVAAEIAADGHDAGVLRSDDYPSLNPGFWVAYAGPYESTEEATAAIAALAGDGWANAYVRCAGTTADCP